MGLGSRLAMIGILIGGYQIYQSRANQKYWKQYEDSLFNSESEGEKVRNRLQGSDVGPEDYMLENPSIYRDWPMVQKGYQSLRMMNDNDNFNSENHAENMEVTFKIQDADMATFYHTTLVPSGLSDEGIVNYVWGNGFEEVDDYWFYLPYDWEGVGEHFLANIMSKTSNAESFSGEWHHFAPCETAGCDGDIEYRDVYYCSSCGQDDTEILIGDTCPECEEVATDTATYAIFYCSDCGEDYTDEYNAEVQTTANKVRTISGKPLQLRKLKKDRDLKPEDAIERLEISAEGEYRKCTICEEPAHPLYRGKGSLEGARRICYSCNKKAMEDKPSFNNTMLFDADEFNAYVYRGKPMEDLTYSQKAVAIKKMIDASDLEATMLQLENAIRLGIISEDELMKELQNKFGSK